MTRLAALLLIVLVAAAALAAPAPVPKPSPPITAANAKDLCPLRDILEDVHELEWGPKRGELTLLSWESSGKVLDAATYKLLRKAAPKKRLIHLAFGPGADKLAWCENTTRVELHDLKAKKMVVLETGNDQPGMKFSPDGKLLATGGYGTQAKLWDAATGAIVRSLDMGAAPGGLSVAFSPDGKQIAVGNRNHTTRLFETASGKLLHELDRSSTQELKFSPDGKTLAVAYVKGDIGLWDATTGALLRSRATGRRKSIHSTGGKRVMCSPPPASRERSSCGAQPI